MVCPSGTQLSKGKVLLLSKNFVRGQQCHQGVHVPPKGDSKVRISHCPLLNWSIWGFQLSRKWLEWALKAGAGFGFSQSSWDSFQSNGNSGSKAGFWGWHLPCASLRCECLGFLDIKTTLKYSLRYCCFLPKLFSLVRFESREIKHSREWFLPTLPRSWNGREPKMLKGNFKGHQSNLQRIWHLTTGFGMSAVETVQIPSILLGIHLTFYWDQWPGHSLVPKGQSDTCRTNRN